MASLAKWGALSGLGAGISQYGEAKRQEWLQAAQQKAQQEADDRREGRADARDAKNAQTQADRDKAAHTRALELEGVKHENTMARDKAKPDPEGRMQRWTNGDYSYRINDKGETEMLGPGENQWKRVAEAGEEGAAPGMNDAELRAGAEDYAKARVNEMAGWATTDKSDFKGFGGSREQARQHFINEFIKSGGNPGGAMPDLDSPPATGNQPATPATVATPPAAPQGPMSGQVIRDPNLATLDPGMLDLYQRAKAAIDASPANRDEVIRRLKAAGIDDATLQTFGF
jgi:hypothetical protein